MCFYWEPTVAVSLTLSPESIWQITAQTASCGLESRFALRNSHQPDDQVAMRSQRRDSFRAIGAGVAGDAAPVSPASLRP
jgi:hypothetical protein